MLGAMIKVKTQARKSRAARKTGAGQDADSTEAEAAAEAEASDSDDEDGSGDVDAEAVGEILSAMPPQNSVEILAALAQCTVPGADTDADGVPLGHGLMLRAMLRMSPAAGSAFRYRSPLHTCLKQTLVY